MDATPRYSDLMARSQALIAEDVLDAVTLTSFSCLLDVGGGEGVFAAAAARRAPHVKVKLFDLPPVAERARLGSGRLGSRAEYKPMAEAS